MALIIPGLGLGWGGGGGGGGGGLSLIPIIQLCYFGNDKVLNFLQQGFESPSSWSKMQSCPVLP